MELSIFLAKLIGLYMVITGLAVVAKQKNIMDQLVKMVKNVSLIFFGGAIDLLIGLAIVLSHNIWLGTPSQTIITLVGWIVLIKALLLMFLPSKSLVELARYFNNRSVLMLKMVFYIAIGLYLAGAGFGMF